MASETRKSILRGITEPTLQKALGQSWDLLNNLKNCQTVNRLDKEQELNPTLLKFAFLSLVKTQSTLYLPMAKEKTTTINGLVLRCTRYDNTAMGRVLGSYYYTGLVQQGHHEKDT